LILDFHIPGVPVPKQSARHRAFIKDGKPMASTYQTKAVKEYESKVASIVGAALPSGFEIHDGPVHVLAVLFAFPAPKSISKKEKDMIASGGWMYKTTKPDVTDNLMKGLFDAMEGVVFTNDSRVCDVRDVRKVYRKKVGTWIRIELKQ